MKRALAVLLWVTVLVASGGAVAVDRWVATTVLPDTIADISVEVRDTDGRLLRAYPVADGLWRLRPADVDPAYIQMLLAYEDQRFWDHPGVDARAMMRAVAQALWYRRAVSGGSTLSMQVARLLEDGTTGQIAGKLRQMRVALALERRLGKTEVLDLYLTHAPFGGNLEGVRAAAQAWFGKPPARLDPHEAALLVALPQSPTRRRPDRFPDQARAARDRVLDRAETAGLLSTDDADRARARDVPRRPLRFPMQAAHLADRLRAAYPDARRIDTTIDGDLQRAMEAVVRQRARQAGPHLSAAVIVADHTNGAIRAMVGSPGYADAPDRAGYVDMATAVRSPGSTLKPLIYGLAFDRGLAHPETVLHDAPIRFDGYTPQNFDGGFRGDVTARTALHLSLNVPVVALTEALGPAHVMSALRDSGATPVVPGGTPGLALSLGGVGLTLHDLVTVYAVLARGGQTGPLRAERIRTAPLSGQAVLSDVAAWQVADILRGVAPPPGAKAGNIAYKTGTSYGYRDAWALGFDGRHVVGVWVGRADGTPVPGLSGAGQAAPFLFDVFGRLPGGAEPLPPPPPQTLIVATGDLPRPLQRFGRGPDSGTSPEFVFPPDGARFADAVVPVKISGGQPPFSVLADGTPLVRSLTRPQVSMGPFGPGFVSLVVVDAAGQTDRVRIRIGAPESARLRQTRANR